MIIYEHVMHWIIVMVVISFIAPMLFRNGNVLLAFIVHGYILYLNLDIIISSIL